MILKLRDDKGGWVLIDQIALVQHVNGFMAGKIKEEEPDPSVGRLRMVYTFVPEFCEYRSIDICGDDGTGEPVTVRCDPQPEVYYAHPDPDAVVQGRVLNVHMRNGDSRTLFAQFDAFILDDSGKTIESLRAVAKIN